MSSEEKARGEGVPPSHSLPELPGTSAFCKAMRQWRHAIAEAGDSQISVTVGEIDRVFLAITKSDLLWRLIYGGEALRIERCPEHQGHWAGIEDRENPCPHGCRLTGWLPLEREHEGRALVSEAEATDDR